MFEVGQKVVCVNNDPNVCPWGQIMDLDGLTVGAIYTIREIFIFNYNLCVRLQEIYREHLGSEFEMPYLALRFRPLVDDKQQLVDYFTLGADPDSEQWDNRRKVPETVTEARGAFIWNAEGIWPIF